MPSNFKRFHQVTLDEAIAEAIANEAPRNPPSLKRCRIDFCDALLPAGSEVCPNGHSQYESKRVRRAERVIK